jgi:hypothetical protein
LWFVLFSVVEARLFFCQVLAWWSNTVALGQPNLAVLGVDPRHGQAAHAVCTVAAPGPLYHVWWDAMAVATAWTLGGSHSPSDNGAYSVILARWMADAALTGSAAAATAAGSADGGARATSRSGAVFFD